MLIEIRKHTPSLLLKLYQHMLRKEYSKITSEDLCVMHKKLESEVYWLKLRTDNLAQKQVMFKEILTAVKNTA